MSPLILFSIPKAFLGHIGVIQTNALMSWARLPDTAVVVLGREEGVEAAARNVDVEHVAEIATNELGTPLISDAFHQMNERYSSSARIYVNADIMLTSRLVHAVRHVQQRWDQPWMIVGRRVDCDLAEPFEFSRDWEARLEQLARQSGQLHGPSGIDYFVCSPDFPFALPTMTVGRPGWDSWFVFEALRRNVRVVDATRCVLALHQNHPPAYVSTGIEARRNIEQAGGLFRVATIRQSNYRMTENREILPNLSGRLLFTAPVRFALGLRRLIRR